MIDWDSHEFHPVVYMPEDYTILDLSGGTWTPPKTEYSVGKYDELRPGLYSTELFSGARFLHIGIDIGAVTPEEIGLAVCAEILALERKITHTEN